jgi:hypothetical protein
LDFDDVKALDDKFFIPVLQSPGISLLVIPKKQTAATTLEVRDSL